MNTVAIVVSAALRVMHPDLYFAGVDTLLKLGKWAGDEGLTDMYDRIANWGSVFNVAASCATDDRCHIGIPNAAQRHLIS